MFCLFPYRYDAALSVQQTSDKGFVITGYISIFNCEHGEDVYLMAHISWISVITGQILPDTKGIEILKKIKRHVPETQVIIITGYGEVKDAVNAMELGAVNYLLKPIDLQELKILVQRALKLTSLV